MTTRSEYIEELHQLDVELVKMGNRVEQAVMNCREAFMESDVKKAKEIVEKDTKINANERQIEALCFHLMLRQAPVATDLRVITTDLKVVTDLERIGDQVSDICELIEEEHDYLKRDLLEPLFKHITQMIHQSVQAYIAKDLDASRKAAEMDDQADALFDSIKNELIGDVRKNTLDVDEALTLIMIAKHLERAGDHCTNLYEWLQFMKKGVIDDVQ